MWDSLALSLTQLYLCLVWQASAVDRKILISLRFGACTVPPRFPRWRGKKPNQLPGNLQHLYDHFMCYTFHLDIDNLTVASATAAMTISTNRNCGGGTRHIRSSRTTSKYNRNLPQRVPHRKCHKIHQVAMRECASVGDGPVVGGERAKSRRGRGSERA